MNASHLPQAARRQVRAAAAQQASVQAQAHGQVPLAMQPAPQPNTNAPAPSTNAPPPPNTNAAPPNLPNVGVDFSPEVRWTPATPQPSNAAPGVQDPAPQPQVADPAPTAQPAASQVDPWEQRYKVLEGKYNSELRRAGRLIEEQSALIGQMRSQMQAPAPAPAAAAPPETRLRQLGATDQQVKEFGPDLVELIATISTNAAAQAAAPIAQQVGQVGQLAQRTAQQAQQENQQHMWRMLSAAIPDAELINGSQEFVDWCAQPDIFSGQARQGGLMQAFQNGDATRVIEIFKAFKEEDARSRATATTRQRQVDPATLYAPSQGRVDGSAAPVTGASSRIWSEQDLRDYYSRVQRGRVPEAEKVATALEIAAAMKEGRIRPDHSTSHLANNP